jgi:hypothetical protein
MADHPNISSNSPGIYNFAGGGGRKRSYVAPEDCSMILDSRECKYRINDKAEFYITPTAQFWLDSRDHYTLSLAHADIFLCRDEKAAVGGSEYQEFIEKTRIIYIVSKALCHQSIVNNRRFEILAPLSYDHTTDLFSHIPYRANLNTAKLMTTSLIDISVCDRFGIPFPDDIVKLDPNSGGHVTLILQINRR